MQNVKHLHFLSVVVLVVEGAQLKKAEMYLFICLDIR